MVNVTSDFIKKYKGLAKEATMEKAMHLKILENKMHAIV
jgi:hypothetical protein